MLGDWSPLTISSNEGQLAGYMEVGSRACFQGAGAEFICLCEGSFECM